MIRIHINDGLSMSVLEGLAKGKSVIWNYDFPFCLPGSTTDKISSSLNKILKENPVPCADAKAHDYIVANFSRERFMALFNEVIDGILKKN